VGGGGWCGGVPPVADEQPSVTDAAKAISRSPSLASVGHYGSPVSPPPPPAECLSREPRRR